MVHFYFRFITFLIGVIIGALLAIRYKDYVVINMSSEVPPRKHIPSYNTWLENQKLKRKDVLWDILRYKRHNYTLESHFLYNNIKVLCVILIRNSKNVKAIENTWGKGCNNIKLIEVNAKSNKGVPAKREKEKSSWVLLCKTLKAMDFEYDWILIANDNTFVILENLRYYIASLKSSENYYMGYAVKFWNTVYNSGEAGYVLSKGTIETFNKHFTETDCSANTYWNREDFYLGKYLSSINITATDTRDSQGYSTFHPYNWYHVFFPGENYYKTSVFPVKCCSKNSISFQAIEGDKMYTYYYLLYTLQIFLDGKLGNRPPVTEIPEDQVWKQFLKERDISSDDITSDQYYKIWENLVDDPNSFAAHMKKEVHFDYD